MNSDNIHRNGLLRTTWKKKTEKKIVLPPISVVKVMLVLIGDNLKKKKSNLCISLCSLL